MALTEYQPYEHDIDFRAALWNLEKGASLARKAWQDGTYFIYIAQYSKDGQIVKHLNRFFHDGTVVIEIALPSEDILADDWYIARLPEWKEEEVKRADEN